MIGKLIVVYKIRWMLGWNYIRFIGWVLFGVGWGWGCRGREVVIIVLFFVLIIEFLLFWVI